MQNLLEQLVERVDGLKCIVVSDRDGVAVLRAPNSMIDDPHSEQIMTTIFSLTTEQTSKSKELGQANFILTFYDSCMCLQANHLPLVITLTADADANAGALIELLPQLKTALNLTRELIMRETDKY